MEKFKVAGIGELLWDIFPKGKQLGGAPCNFAYHAFQAGCEAYVVSSVGTDSSGAEILAHFDALGLDKSCVQQSAGSPTGTVTVSLDGKGIPAYTIHTDVAWDKIVWNDALEELAQTVDAVCFGSLAQRNAVSRETILKFLRSTHPDCLKVFDVNLRQSFYNRETLLQSLEMANVLKLNDDELPVVAKLFDLEGTEEELLARLIREYKLKLIALTKGDKGSILMTDLEKSILEVPKVKVEDTVGAGDSFTAFLVAGLLKGEQLKNIHEAATRVAAFVCTQKGATPKLPESILKKSIN